MTDLEMTKLCAEAMGGELRDGVLHFRLGDVPPHIVGNTISDGKIYDPLHNDAQAMALVRRFGLDIHGARWIDDIWRVIAWPDRDSQHDGLGAEGKDLNRAIVECVAKMQSSVTASA